MPEEVLLRDARRETDGGSEALVPVRNRGDLDGGMTHLLSLRTVTVSLLRYAVGAMLRGQQT